MIMMMIYDKIPCVQNLNCERRPLRMLVQYGNLSDDVFFFVCPDLQAPKPVVL